MANIKKYKYCNNIVDIEDGIVQAIKKIAERYSIYKIILFGSRARGDNKKNSDIDLAVYTCCGFANQGSFSADIEDLETLLKIDLVFINEDTDKDLLQRINTEGVIIYE